ncbi:MAG TPA: hypothetical protein VJM33_05565 [Microthrixaceae bacterium]|nr:hypothetical protein [Microthrixaceae bacterium]
MRHVLIVAHQTLRSPQLREAIADRAAAGPVTFHLVVPMSHGDGFTWNEGQVHVEAEHRLEEARLAYLAEGYAVTGEVGDSNPAYAVDNVLRRGDRTSFDEIVVSTLPSRISKWMGMDAPARIRRSTHVTVTHLESEIAHH